MKISIKSQTVLKRSQKKAKPIISKPEKSPSFVCGIAIPFHIETSKLQKSQKFSSKFELSLAWPCIRAHY